MDQRINSVVYAKVNPLISPSKEMGDRTRQRKKSPTSAGIEHTTTGFDRRLLYRLNYKARRVQIVGN